MYLKLSWIADEVLWFGPDHVWNPRNKIEQMRLIFFYSAYIWLIGSMEDVRWVNHIHGFITYGSTRFFECLLSFIHSIPQHCLCILDALAHFNWSRSHTEISFELGGFLLIFFQFFLFYLQFPLFSVLKAFSLSIAIVAATDQNLPLRF